MPSTHPYIPNASSSSREMLKEVGLEKLEDLFTDLGKRGDKCFGGALRPDPMDEVEIRAHMEGLLSKNVPFDKRCFAGGGPWFHYVPSVVGQMVSRGEFLTSYTP